MPELSKLSQRKQLNPATEALLQKHRKPKQQFICIACQDTGKNSNGNPCYPCLIHQRLKDRNNEDD